MQFFDYTHQYAPTCTSYLHIHVLSRNLLYIFFLKDNVAYKGKVYLNLSPPLEL
jgi:hypothetical protein